MSSARSRLPTRRSRYFKNERWFSSRISSALPGVRMPPPSLFSLGISNEYGTEPREFPLAKASQGRSVDRLIGLDGVLSDIAMMRIPDGHGRVELTKFRRPTADSAEPNNAPPNTLGIRRIMFAVEDIDDVVARLRAHGAELVGELVQYENSYRLCYVRGPEGILVALAEKIG